jgi:hypothetical protein
MKKIGVAEDSCRVLREGERWEAIRVALSGHFSGREPTADGFEIFKPEWGTARR